MKKFLIAAATGLLIFGGQAGTEAATVDATVENLNAQTVQTKDMGKWARFRDDLLGRHRHDRYGPPPGRHGYGPPPPPPGRRGYGPPPPPPPPPPPGWHRDPYGPPPPPPPPPPGRRGYGPPPPRW